MRSRDELRREPHRDARIVGASDQPGDSRGVELESIDLVSLTEQLEITYGPEVDFAGWIADMELDDIIALTVGDLAAFVVRSTSGSDVAAGA